MSPAAGPFRAGTRAVLATMHGKERVIAPILREALGLDVVLAAGLDTDTFGTFTRETDRPGTQVETARLKAQAGLRMDPAAIGIASEGSFFAHPHIPFVPMAQEIVLLLERTGGLEIAGIDEGIETNDGHVVATGIEAAMAFAEASGFPAHGLVVMASRDGMPDPRRLLRKDIGDPDTLADAIGQAILLSGAAHVETDMRAHRNPTRMAAIERATQTSCSASAAAAPFVTTRALPRLGACRDCPAAPVARPQGRSRQPEWVAWVAATRSPKSARRRLLPTPPHATCAIHERGRAVPGAHQGRQEPAR